MITLQNFFNILASGEFSHIAIGNSIAETIVADKYPKIIDSLNLGLTELYKRFPLKTKEIDLYEQTGLTTYFIRPDYISTSIGSVSQRAYLIDSELDPFQGDLIKITDAYDADGGTIHINNKLYPEVGIFTTAFDTIKLTVADEPRVISLVYKANYPRITITDDFDPEIIELHFPDWIHEPLLSYIAARLFKGKASKASEGEGNLYTTFMYQFEASCKNIELLGLAERTDSPSENFTNNRWV